MNDDIARVEEEIKLERKKHGDLRKSVLVIEFNIIKEYENYLRKDIFAGMKIESRISTARDPNNRSTIAQRIKLKEEDLSKIKQKCFRTKAENREYKITIDKLRKERIINEKLFIRLVKNLILFEPKTRKKN